MRSAGDTRKKSKKEKKKRKSDESPNAEAGISPPEFTLNQHSCRKKRKKEKNSREELDESQDHCHSPPKKKNKLSDGSGQDKKADLEMSTSLITNRNTEIESGTYKLDPENEYSSKRKKKKEKRKGKGDLIFPGNESSKESGDRVIESSTAEVIDISVDSKAKKKKKIKKHKKVKEYEDFQASSDEKSHEGQNEDINTTHNDTPSKKKKKKKKSKNIDEKEEDGELDKKSMLEDTMETFTASNHEDERKSKKKKKKSKKENDSEIINEETEGTDDNSTMKQHRNTEMSSSDKAGADKSGIISTSPKVGQWGTAGFDNDKQQEKFLRLLGGFKTGSRLGGKTNMLEKFTKASGSNPDQGVVNCAMNKHEEEKYKRNMENQYEKAMSMNLNRGIGLGFDTTSIGKKFHIDKFQSKSMKFDD